MAWNLVTANHKPLRHWSFTSAVEGAFFRLKHQSAPSRPRAWIAQAELLSANNYQLYDVQPLEPKAPLEIIRLDKPAFFNQRCLAFLQSEFTQNWSIQIEVSDVMPLTNASGSVTVAPNTSSTAAPTSVSASTTAGAILAANSSRKGATLHNNSTANLFVELGPLSAGVSSTSFAVKLAPQSYYEVPYSYTGIITGLWDAANGSCLVRELT